jgi:hypothetical protein
MQTSKKLAKQTVGNNDIIGVVYDNHPTRRETELNIKR